MAAMTRVRTHLLAGFIVSILLIHLPVVYTVFYSDLSGVEAARGGEIDLGGVSLEKGAVLEGEWEFYWDRLLISEGSRGVRPDFLIQVPGYWSQYRLDGEYLPSGGVASYRLQLNAVDHPDPVSLSISDFGCAYRVYIDGRLTASSGLISRNPEKIFSVPQTDLFPVVLAAEGSHEVVIEVASQRFSGLYMAPVIKDHARVLAWIGLRDKVRFMLFGTVIFAFFILLVTYFFNHGGGISSLWLPFLMLLVIFRLMLTSRFFSFWQEIGIIRGSYEGSNGWMFFVTFALKYLLIFLAQEQFNLRFSRREKVGLFLYYALLYLVYLRVPAGVYNRHLSLVLPLASFTLEIFVFVKLFIMGLPPRKYGVPVYWASLLAISGLAMDSYYLNGNSYVDLSLSLLFFLTVYLVVLSLVRILGWMDTVKNYALSTMRLEHAKRQINLQRDYYLALNERIEEVRSLKHDLRHFATVMKQLVEDRRYPELGRFLRDYTQKTETEPLPVFCEHAVANSILGYYALKAAENSLQFNCRCEIPENLPVSESDLCITLGNALENAYEACLSSEEVSRGYIFVEVRHFAGQILMMIENSYSKEPLRIDGEYLSSKEGSSRGLGLSSIRRVIKASGGYIGIEHDQGIFRLKAALPVPYQDQVPATEEL